MAYVPQQLRVMEDDIVGDNTRFCYLTIDSVDTIAECLAADFFSDGWLRGMRLGDEVDILSVDDIELPTVVAGRFKGIVTVEGTKADPPATVAGLNASWVAMTFQATTAILTTTISQVATSGKWAFATSTAANALVIRCRQMQADLEELTQKLETAGLITVTGN
jgi:hypothetical protein